MFINLVLRMNKIAFIFTLLFSLNSFAAQNYIVAKVNDTAITRQELLDRFRVIVKIAGINIRSKSDRKIFLSQSLEKMIDNEIVRQEGKKLEISVSSAELDETLDLVALQQKQSRKQIKNYFKRNGISFDSYVKQVESEILWSKIVSGVIRPRVKVTEVEVRELFEQKKLNTSTKKFFISEVVIPKGKNAKLLSQKLVSELKGGASFRNIVKQFSSSISSENDGEIGWVAQGDIDKNVYNAISKLKKGEYSKAINLPDGYHIFKVLDVKIDQIIPSKEMKVAKDIIFERKLRSAAKGYLMKLRRNAFIEISL